MKQLNDYKPEEFGANGFEINSLIMEKASDCVVARMEKASHIQKNSVNVICITCGSSDVLCEAMINPNTKEVENYIDESFLNGWCNSCKAGTILTDTNDVKNKIDNAFHKFCEKNGCEPRYAICAVTWNDDNGCEDVKIKMSADSGEEDDYFFYCNSLSNLKALCDYGCVDFIVTDLISFEK